MMYEWKEDLAHRVKRAVDKFCGPFGDSKMAQEIKQWLGRRVYEIYFPIDTETDHLFYD